MIAPSVIERPTTVLFVPGRAHDVTPEGELILSPSSVARVETAVQYYKDNEETFRTDGGWVRFEGGWAASAGGVERPPLEQREGLLMAQLAIKMGLPAHFIVAGVNSTSTMENCLQARHSLTGLGRVAIVTQQSQADRLLFCAEKTMPNISFSILTAPGEENQTIIDEEQSLLRQSRLLYGWANSPRLLRFADRVGTLASAILNRRPAAKYATAAR